MNKKTPKDPYSFSSHLFSTWEVALVMLCCAFLGFVAGLLYKTYADMPKGDLVVATGEHLRSRPGFQISYWSEGKVTYLGEADWAHFSNLQAADSIIINTSEP